MRHLSRFVVAALAITVFCGLAAPATAQLLNGTTSGSWNLPENSNDGSASGVLLDDTFNVAFTMGASLTETGSGRGKRQGNLNGKLKNTSGVTVWDVVGTWTANKKGTGSFDALIGVSFGSTFLVVGVISGKFDDSGKGVGTYIGTWAFNQF